MCLPVASVTAAAVVVVTDEDVAASVISSLGLKASLRSCWDGAVSFALDAFFFFLNMVLNGRIFVCVAVCMCCCWLLCCCCAVFYSARINFAGKRDKGKGSE